MPNVTVTVFRRDMLGQACLICSGGVYRHAASDSYVSCPRCGDEPERWLTKKEMLLHMAQTREAA